jgi:hypothetical protein
VLDQDPSALEDARSQYDGAIRLLKPRMPGRGDTWNDLQKEYGLRLYQCLGSLGGTWRDGAELETDAREKQTCWDRAIGCYDEGYGIESGSDQRYPDFQFADSYNLLQRLVVRILREPKCLNDPSVELGKGLAVPQELARAEQIVAGQLNEVRMNDAWAMADLALLRILRGQPREDAWRQFAESNRSSEAYEANHRAFAALVKSGEQHEHSPQWLAAARDTVGWLAERLKTLYAIEV